jgi:phosphonate transport system permease protein
VSVSTAPATQRRLPVPPKPRRGSTYAVAAVVVTILVLLHVVAIRKTGFSLGELAHGWHGIWAFFAGDAQTTGAFPPDLSWSTIKPALGECVVTFSMGLLGTTLSIPFALLLAFLGARTTSKNVVVYQTARGLMSFFRAVPSFIWGLIFVTAVGLGAFPGVLAILVHNMGVMGKLWSEAMEETDEGPVDALRAAGARSSQTATHVVLPSVLPQFASLFLYRVDVNVRDSLTLGIVGAGGIGFYITQAIQQFQFDTMLTYVLMVLIMVIALDLLSAALRRRIAR